MAATVHASQAVLVTGAARGMGLACARVLGERGHAITLLDVDGEAVSGATNALLARGINARADAADVCSASSIREAVDRATRAFGPPAILVNAAGLLRGTPTLEITEEEWDTVVGVSLKGTFLTAQACLPGMIAASWGRIVNFSSTAGKAVSTLGGPHYTAAKSGLLGLTRALAHENARHGVCVNAVCPGLIDTPMVRDFCDDEDLRRYSEVFPIARLGRPEEVAELVAYLCSDNGAYITGAALDINGGDLMV